MPHSSHQTSEASISQTVPVDGISVSVVPNMSNCAAFTEGTFRFVRPDAASATRLAPVSETCKRDRRNTRAGEYHMECSVVKSRRFLVRNFSTGWGQSWGKPWYTYPQVKRFRTATIRDSVWTQIMRMFLGMILALGDPIRNENDSSSQKRRKVDRTEYSTQMECFGKGPSLYAS